ncbi:response regulator transcription factor [Alteromonas sp. a30]|uniref:response regulator transcription factor n=1 Tax=Alteromonas sp. a30 TaxID=2730917 RepID=UPI00227E51EF|nr:response regulator [Alteromonas sp. a30]MCY7295369.1 response regulator [Alteromonas sp. a30]
MKHDILIADDDEHLREVLDVMFRDSFNIYFSETGQETIEIIKKHNFHFVILDIHLPGKSGIEICREVSVLEIAKQPQIVILSADSNENLVREAYELGVGDYICKPFNVTAFKERMLRFSRDIDKIRELESKDSDIKGIAETVMMQSASYGSGLELIARMNKCHSARTLANELMMYMLNQGFHTAVQLRSKTRLYSYDADVNECSDIEMQIFDLLKSHGRIYHFGKRSIFNDNHVSVLVKNMPLAGTRSYDNLLDLLAKMVPAIDARFIAICEHQALIEAKKSLDGAVTLIGENLESMDKEQREILINIENKVSQSFHQLHLDEEQEAYFVNLIETEITKREATDSLEKVQETLGKCREALNVVEEKQEQPVVEEVKDADVELF